MKILNDVEVKELTDKPTSLRSNVKNALMASMVLLLTGDAGNALKEKHKKSAGLFFTTKELINREFISFNGKTARVLAESLSASLKTVEVVATNEQVMLKNGSKGIRTVGFVVKFR